MKNKVVATAVLFVMVTLMFANIASAFNDLNGHWAESYAIELNERGILAGDERGNANLTHNIKRSEFISLLVRSLYGSEITYSSGMRFYDVPGSAWFYNTVSFAAELGLVKGDGSGYFYPDSLIKREEIVLMIARALGLEEGSSSFSDVPASYKYYSEISAVAQTKIITGYDDGTFGPVLLATRGEAAAMISRMLDCADKLPGPLPTYSPIPIPTGDGRKINLTWHQTYSTGITKTGNHMAGVNVISPMWFKVIDNTGLKPNSYEHALEGGINFYIEDLGNMDYINDARMEGYDIWPIFKTNFKPGETSKFLNNAEARRSAVEVMGRMIDKYGLDGINIDFENMNVSDKDIFTQFVGEMYIMCREKGVKLSVDVTKYNQYGGTWSLCYDRAALAQNVDYVALMAYDENGTFSTKGGSVASLPWVEDAIKLTLQEVPAEKLLLGVPFYTRLWEEEGGKVVKTSAIGMQTAANKIAEAGANIVYDAATGQNYAQWQSGNRTYKIWLEDKTSIQARIDLIHKYNLAGIASWSKTFETSDIWAFIDEKLQK